MNRHFCLEPSVSTKNNFDFCTLLYLCFNRQFYSMHTGEAHSFLFIAWLNQSLFTLQASDQLDRLRLTFTDFDIEPDFICRYDWVKVYEVHTNTDGKF